MSLTRLHIVDVMIKVALGAHRIGSHRIRGHFQGCAESKLEPTLSRLSALGQCKKAKDLELVFRSFASKVTSLLRNKKLG